MTDDHDPNNRTKGPLGKHLTALKIEAGMALGGIITTAVIAYINLAAANGDVTDARFHYGIGCALAAVILIVGALAAHCHHTSSSANIILAEEFRDLRSGFEAHDHRVVERFGRLINLEVHHGEALDNLRVACGDELAPRRNGSHDN